MIEIIKNNIPKGPIKTNVVLNGKPITKTRRPGVKITPTIIIVHSTANPKSTAMNERNWLLNVINDRSASWNYAVDQLHAVEAIPAGELSYNTLDARANHSSISVEICESGDREKTLRNAVELVAVLMKEWRIPIENVFPHRQYQKKDCPRILQPGAAWNGFISSVKEKHTPGIDYALDRINRSMNSHGMTPLSLAYWLINAQAGQVCRGEWVQEAYVRIAKLLDAAGVK